jgi:hypothetical protein
MAAPASGAEKGTAKMEAATIAARCFWGVEATFQSIKGVKSTLVGYTGGLFDSPTYKYVCTDRTGHAEAVQIEYDPTQVSYDQLLDVFWRNHDPAEALQWLREAALEGHPVAIEACSLRCEESERRRGRGAYRGAAVASDEPIG